MRNPFEAFKTYVLEEQEIPLDGIIASRARALEAMIQGYEKLLEEEVKEVVWLARSSTIARAYAVAEAHAQSIDYDAEDIEEFCFELDKGDQISYLVSGPSGLYLSALCNCAREQEISLQLGELERTIHLLGYRLPEGKRLVIEGEMGDFFGVNMEGGELLVEGSVRNWTGAGMKQGKIVVSRNVGHHTGEWMTGGEIWIGGRVGGLGDIKDGKIYEQSRLRYPPADQHPASSSGKYEM